MLRNLLYTISGYLLLVSSTCERPVDLPFEIPESRLVVVCNFTDKAFFVVQVTKSYGVLDEQEPEYIADAKVDIYEGDTFIETLELVPGGGPSRLPYYITRVLKPQQGVIYTIHVEAPGFEPVTAQSSMPEAMEILSFGISNVEVEPGDNGAIRYNYVADIRYEDTPEAPNYYHFNLYQQFLAYEFAEGDTVYIDSTIQNIIFSSSINNNSLLAHFAGGILFEDKAFPTNHISIPVTVQINPQSQMVGKVYAELRTVSEDYYKYHQTINLQQTSPEGVFTEPVIVYNNIENGHGIFAGYNASTDSISLRRH